VTLAQGLSVVTDVLSILLVFAGLTFCLLASVGLVRMPDLYMRMQAAGKASTLGVALIAVGAAVHFGSAMAVVLCTLMIVFFFATAPISAHLISRAAYGVGVKPDPRTFRDDLAVARAKSKTDAGPPSTAPYNPGETRYQIVAGRRSA